MRILIVEDEVRLAKALQEILIKNRYSVDIVHDGVSGLDYALSGVYDAIVLDIMLPKMNGIDVLIQLRKAKQATPVLLLTARDEVSDKVRGLDSGADDYLTKPFATEELLARIRSMTRRHAQICEDVLTFSDISLHLKTGDLCCAGHSVKLGLKEFQILELLLANQKHIVTKERFIEKIWGYDSDTGYNNVEVYISFLRKKLAHVHSCVEIKTARGMGYFLEEQGEQV